MKEREFHVNSVQVYTLADKSDYSFCNCEYISLAVDLEINPLSMDKQIPRSFPERPAYTLYIIDS
jgi:hypothetical protein